MSEVKNVIESQIEKILNEKNFFDYTFTHSKNKVSIIVNNDKSITIDYQKYSEKQIKHNDPKWQNYLICVLNKEIKDCKCCFIVCLKNGKKIDDLNLEGVNYQLKDIYNYALNGFSCYSTEENMHKMESLNVNSITMCIRDNSVKAIANNNVQTVGPFINRLGIQNSSRRAGTKNPAFPIPSNIYAIVMDSGILQTHPDLRTKISTNYSRNFTTNNRNAWNDDNGHGTHVAGIIAAQDNNLGIVGNAPNVNLIAIKILNSQGGGSYSNLIAGLDYIAQWKLLNPSFKAVINMSIGGPAYTPFDTAVKNIIIVHGIPCVVAAGNDGDNAVNYSPARIPEAITVGAYNNANNTMASFSNYGSLVDLFAPGVSIDSCYLRNGYAVLSGTSMASPMVAGIVVDLMANPNYNTFNTPAKIRDKLVQDAQILSPKCFNGVTGSNPNIIITTAAINAGTTNRSVYGGMY